MNEVFNLYFDIREKFVGDLCLCPKLQIIMASACPWLFEFPIIIGLSAGRYNKIPAGTADESLSLVLVFSNKENPPKI